MPLIFDIAVIGAGTAGLRFAIKASKKVNSVALVENSLIGGTCLNKGCIPTKSLLYSAEIYRKVRNSSSFGIKAKGVSFDFDKVMARSQGIVSYGRKHAEKSIKNIKNIRLFRGSAKFISKDTFIADNQKIKAKKIIISTGLRPFVPPIKGIEGIKYWTNEEALVNRKLPKSLGIIGGGFIAAEFATFFGSFGCRVYIFEMAPKIVSALDDDAREVVEESLGKMGVKAYTSVKVAELSKKGKNIIISAKDIKSGKVKKVEVEKLLVAAGRCPNTDTLNLREAKVDVNRRGYIKVNKYFRTSNTSIYAVGDVNGRALFSHAAKRQVRALCNNLFNKAKETINFGIMPWAIFTYPAIGGVGMSEKQAIEKGFKVGVLKAKFSSTGKAAVIGETEGFVKIVFDNKTKRILGSVIVGPDADNLIHEIVSVMNTKPYIESIKSTIHVHPTLAEVMEELKEQ